MLLTVVSHTPIQEKTSRVNTKYKIQNCRFFYYFCSAKQLLTCDCVSNDLTAEWITVRLGHFSSKTLDGRSSTSNSSNVLDTLPERNKPIKHNFQYFQYFLGDLKYKYLLPVDSMHTLCVYA